MNEFIQCLEGKKTPKNQPKKCHRVIPSFSFPFPIPCLQHFLGLQFGEVLGNWEKELSSAGKISDVILWDDLRDLGASICGTFPLVFHVGIVCCVPN